MKNEMSASASAQLIKPVLLAFSLLTFLAPLSAANWPQWRGPEFNGSSSEKNLPSSWSKTENVVWAAEMPGAGAATPIIWQNHIFVSSTDRRTKSTVAMAMDRRTGRVLWREVIGEGDSRDERSTFASPSPTTDGKRVIFYYGNGELVAFDFSGQKLWRRNLQKDYGEFAFQWTYSSSPVLFEGRLYMQVLQRDTQVNGRGAKPSGIESYLLSLDPETGKTQWQHFRKADAVAESLEAFATPMPFVQNGRKELLVAGGDCLTGHDLQTGKEIWRWGTWNPAKVASWRLVVSPVAGDGVVLACAPKKNPVYAVKAGGTGVLNEADLLWKSEPKEVSSDVPTPLFFEGDFFVLSDGAKTLSRIEPKTGKVKWSVRTPGSAKFEASPTGADGKIYCVNMNGDVLVANSTDGSALSFIPMGEPGENNTRSTVVVSQGQVFVRTDSKLYCVGNPAPQQSKPAEPVPATRIGQPENVKRRLPL
jgi:outer membrane protein assembly factor BamB